MTLTTDPLDGGMKVLTGFPLTPKQITLNYNFMPNCVYKLGCLLCMLWLLEPTA